MATVRKVTAKIKVAPKPEKAVAHAKAVEAPAAKVEASESDEKTVIAAKTKKTCHWCDTKSEPVYTDVTGLRRFVSDRGRINTRSRSGNCSKHQRRVAREVKHARHLALLPFVVRV